jgi:uncharacterized protein (TIGR02246 family)
MRALRIIVACCLLALAQPVLAAGPDDEQAIRDLQRLWDEAWNSHDIAALGSLVAEDVRFVNVAGVVLSGRNEFEKLQTRTHAMQFKESVRTVSGAEIKFIAPEIAVAHVKWNMRGDKDSDGRPREPRNGVMMQVLMKRNGKWTVVAAQNTDIRWPPGTQNRTR